MRPVELGLRKPDTNPMCFVDSNIFLELELDQRHADEYEAFLHKIKRGLLKAIIMGFHVDSVLIVIENYGKSPKDLRTFLSSLLGYKGLEIYYLSLLDRILTTKYMEKFNLELDDALAYYIMKKFNIIRIISYDKHFGTISDITRLEPSQL